MVLPFSFFLQPISVCLCASSNCPRTSDGKLSCCCPVFVKKHLPCFRYQWPVHPVCTLCLVVVFVLVFVAIVHALQATGSPLALRVWNLPKCHVPMWKPLIRQVPQCLSIGIDVQFLLCPWICTLHLPKYLTNLTVFFSRNLMSYSRVEIPAASLACSFALVGPYTNASNSPNPKYHSGKQWWEITENVLNDAFVADVLFAATSDWPILLCLLCLKTVSSQQRNCFWSLDIARQEKKTDFDLTYEPCQRKSTHISQHLPIHCVWNNAVLFDITFWSVGSK